MPKDRLDASSVVLKGRSGPPDELAGAVAAANPLHVIATMLLLAGMAYRLMFSGLSASFLDNCVANLIFFTAIVFYLASMMRSDATPLRVNLPAGALILFVVTYLLAGKSSGYPRGAVPEVVDLAALAALFTMLSGKLLRREHAPWAATFLVALASMVAVVGFYQKWYEFPRLAADLDALELPGWVGGQYIDARSVADFRTRVEHPEVYSTFFPVNVLPGFLALSLPATLALAAAAWRGAASRAARGAAVAVCVVLAVAQVVLLASTESKAGTAAVALGVGLFVVLAFYRLASRRLFFTVLPALAIVAVVGVFAALPRAEQFFNEARTSLAVRVGYWNATWRMIKADPYLGVGPGSFAQSYVSYKDLGEREVKNPHNAYLLIWAQGGVFSLLFFLCFWVLAFAGPRKRAGPATAAPGRAFTAAALVAAAVLYVMLRGFAVIELDPLLHLAVAGGAVVAAAVVLALWKGLAGADAGLVIAGLSAGLIAFLAAIAVDVTFSDAGAATAAVLVAAAISPRGKAAVLKPGNSTSITVAALAAAGLFLYVWIIFIPYSQAEMALAEAREMMARGSFIAAGDRARAAMALDPHNPEPPTRLAATYEAAARSGHDGNSNFALAEEFYQRALHLDCGYIPAQDGLARLYAFAGPEYLARALMAHDVLLRLHPTNSQYHIRAAALLEQAAKPAAALEHYARALAIDDRVEQHGIQLSPEEKASVEARIRDLERRMRTPAG